MMIAVAMHQVVIPAARQGVVQRPEHGPRQADVAGGGVPLGDPQADVTAGGVRRRSAPGTHPRLLRAAEIINGVVVRANIVEILPRRSSSSPGDGECGHQLDARVRGLHRLAELGDALLIGLIAQLVADLPETSRRRARRGRWRPAACPSASSRAVEVLDLHRRRPWAFSGKADANQRFGPDPLAEFKELLEAGVARLQPAPARRERDALGRIADGAVQSKPSWCCRRNG